MSIAADIDLMRDVYMTKAQREAYERISSLATLQDGAREKGEAVAWRIVGDDGNALCFEDSAEKAANWSGFYTAVPLYEHPATQPAQASEKVPEFVMCRCYDDAAKRLCADRSRCSRAYAQSTHPQPVTPAGGEVEPVAWAHDVSGDVHIITKSVKDLLTASKSIYVGHYNTPLYTHPPVADAALEHRVMEAMVETLQGIATALGVDPNDGDPDLIYGAIDELAQDAERYWWLRTHGKAQADVAYSFIGDEMDAAIDAALNQRGGG